ncbi:hypothetical protein BC943DRAFT_378473 [Umbelopsis sp. AD052]|nr:hypothetical protein BC943DRAFT_378473 [Umbelopsis sp. AD052]
MNGLHREWQTPPVMPDQPPYPLMDAGYSLPSHRDLSPSERPDLASSSSSSRVLSQPGTPQPSGKDPYSPPPRQAPYPTWISNPSPKKKRTLSSQSQHTEPSPVETELPHNGPMFTTKDRYGNLFALDQSTVFDPRVDAKIDRGFFLADGDWTCYRRNYFQLSATFSIDGLGSYNEHEIPCLVDFNGRLHRVQQFMLGISSHMYNSRDKVIDLIQHTAKRDRGPRNTPPLVPITAGGDLRLSSIGTTQTIATFERVQFKTATANNGRRRAAQQYHILCVEVYAQTEAGQQIKICVAESERLVVRGRSPGHYNDHNVRYSTQYSRKQASEAAQTDYPSSYHKPPILSPSAMTPTADYGPTSYSSYGYHAYNGIGGSPYQQQNGPSYHPVMVTEGSQQPMGIPSISDPSSSESSSPDLHNAEFADNRAGPYHHPYDAQVVRPLPSNAGPPPYYGREGGDDSHPDWQRNRAASGSSISTDHSAYTYPAYSSHHHYLPRNGQYDLRAGHPHQQPPQMQDYPSREPPPMRWHSSHHHDYVHESDHYQAQSMAPPYSYDERKGKSDIASSSADRHKDVNTYDDKNASERQQLP